jgi:hypothetical protein
MVVRDRSKLSKDPEQIRKRLRRSSRNHEEDVAILASIRKPIEEWDIEELAQGKPRCKDGSFKGPAPRWITPAVLREAKRRLQLAAFDKMSGHVSAAIDVMYNMMTSDELDDSGKPIIDNATKLKCAIFIIEQTVGKAKNRVELDAADNLKAMLASALVLPSGGPAHPVINGQFTTAEEDDDEDE